MHSNCRNAADAVAAVGFLNCDVTTVCAGNLLILSLPILLSEQFTSLYLLPITPSRAGRPNTSQTPAPLLPYSTHHDQLRASPD